MARPRKPVEHLLDIYSVWLHAADHPKAHAKIAARFGLDLKAEASGRTTLFIDRVNGFPHVAIWVDAKAHQGDVALLIDTYAHEATHAASAILDHVGQAYDGTSEALAYLSGWITSWLWRSFNGHE